MSEKTVKIIGWVLTSLLGLVFLGSAYGKLAGIEATVLMAETWGVDASTLQLIGAIELLSITLFIIGRTGVLGALLLVAYMGGAIAIHVANQLPLMAPVIVSIAVWITAAVRFPELRKRLF